MFSLRVVKDRVLLLVFGLSLLIFAFTFSMAGIFLGGINTPLVMHFNSDQGIIDFIGWRLDVLGLLLAAFFMMGANLILAEFLYYRERFLSYIFAFFSLLFSVLILMTVSGIVLIN